jgi:hypothetical protein
MPWTSEHLNWLVDTGDVITTECGKTANVFRFDYDVNNQEVMSRWAKHFRNYYCSDNQIDLLKSPSQTRADYLIKMKFPDQKNPPGPSIRSGDFAEILVADYLTYLQGYNVPRTRYDRKGVPNESTKGSDVLAFKRDSDDQRKDVLLVYEVKANLSAKPKPMLQEAIDHSAKDYMRLGESLNGIKQRMLDRQDMEGFALIKRFQEPENNPYRTRFGAAAVCSNSGFDKNVLGIAKTSLHPFRQDLELLAFHGEELMALAHMLYERAANEV